MPIKLFLEYLNINHRRLMMFYERKIKYYKITYSHQFIKMVFLMTIVGLVNTLIDLTTNEYKSIAI